MASGKKLVGGTFDVRGKEGNVEVASSGPSRAFRVVPLKSFVDVVRGKQLRGRVEDE